MKLVIGLTAVLEVALSGAVAVGQASPVVPTGATHVAASEPNGLNGLVSDAIGRVAASPVPPNTRGVDIGAIPANSAETAVAEATTEEAPRPEGRIDSAILNREIDARFGALEHCRMDVARRKQLPPAQIVADSLTMRWTIQAAGDVALTEVVASTPVDGGVMDCVARDMRQWRFTPPKGGTLRLERILTFRPLKSDGQRTDR